MCPTTIERIIDKQVRMWEMNRELLAATRGGDDGRRRPVVTVSRQLGSCHGELAQGLADRLGLQVHGRDIIDEIAADKGLERRIVEALDERTRSEMNIWMSGLLNRRLFSHDEFAMALAKTVKALASMGGVVLVGRGANWILDEAECMRVRVIAPMDRRVANIAGTEGVTAAEAAAMIAVSDEERSAFVRRIFDADWEDPLAYDLVLNTDYMDLDRAVEVVAVGMAAKGMFVGGAEAAR
jgi:cytidylate kinase